MYLKTTEVTCMGGNADSFRPQENKQDKPDTDSDKSFCFVLDDVIRKAYPNSREYEKEGII